MRTSGELRSGVMTSQRRRVVMTGAAGRIGRAIAPELRARWELVETDLYGRDGYVELDISDLARCRQLFAGAAAVVHLAADPRPYAPWDDLLAPNIVGAYNVAQAAVDCEVPRLVLASSLQAVTGRPPLTCTRSSDPPRPANLYGATKAWAEAIGSWVASVSPTTVVAVRIGYFTNERPPVVAERLSSCANWLSPRDACELIRAAVEAEGFAFVVVNGVSANRHLEAELSDATVVIGYRPTDDAWSET